ncbi:aspartate aminotransferase family protein [Jiella sp. MQZ9-1]|uniref:Aspartate aminotransferase family protein n=1 Tax=Jiella flava TaxID=2816857 RepID=A0A939G0U8_9HYPH|nr:aspartate aminotransferase family protein [Jiella flava]MBO0663107.1 aspartate aminotransferase family protein [Jiella flava]MCD2471526.1 aspartate aminotransferase family protein [Jiella flava]
MSQIPNSIEARDKAFQMHPLVNLREHEKIGSLVIDRGEGVYVFDTEGKRYFEGLAGLWSVAVGFGEKRLAAVAKAQMEKLAYYHLFSYKTHGPSVELAEKLINIAPVPMSKVHFTSSGSEANDLVVKLCWYRSNALGKPEKKKVIGRTKGYHGVTIASGSITGLARNHASFDLPLDRMRHTHCPDFDTMAEPGESEVAFSKRMASELEKLILEEGPETIAAFFGEPVMGSGGVYVPPETYWQEIQAVLKKYDILLVADEVITGFGRTGNWFGTETFGMQPDVMVISKQMASSYMPIAAVLMSENFYAPIADESDRIGVFGHGFTASGHPVATAVALENIKIIEERDLVGNCRTLAPRFLGHLDALSRHPRVKLKRGIGMIGALELHPDGEPGMAGTAMAAAALEEGVIGRAVGDAFCLCPPLIITAEEVDQMFAAVGRALDRLA